LEKLGTSFGDLGPV